MKMTGILLMLSFLSILQNLTVCHQKANSCIKILNLFLFLLLLYFRMILSTNFIKGNSRTMLSANRYSSIFCNQGLQLQPVEP